MSDSQISILSLFLSLSSLTLTRHFLGFHDLGLRSRSRTCGTGCSNEGFQGGVTGVQSLKCEGTNQAEDDFPVIRAPLLYLCSFFGGDGNLLLLSCSEEHTGRFAIELYIATKISTKENFLGSIEGYQRPTQVQSVGWLERTSFIYLSARETMAVGASPCSFMPIAKAP